MNALRHGKYAERPDPVKLLLGGSSGGEKSNMRNKERTHYVI